MSYEIANSLRPAFAAAYPSRSRATDRTAAAPLTAQAYRPDIDGVRAVAVSAVVIGHAFPRALPGGFVGVDIFFVISGYLISSILMRDLREDRFSLLDFYKRRVLRIFPVLVATLLAIALCGWFVLYRPEFAGLGRHLFASTLFFENVQLSSEIGYFDARAATKPTLHLWSLAIEEQFYLAWPLLLALAWRWRIPFRLWFIVLGLASFAASVHGVGADPSTAYFSPFGRAWELVVGALVAEFTARNPDRFGRWRDLAAVLGATLIGLALWLLRPHMPFPGVLALFPTVGAALLIAAGGRAGINARVLASAPLVGCGLVSYPLYLWHWPMLSFARVLYGELSPALAGASVGAALLAAFASYRWLEWPLRRLELPGKPLILAGALLAVATLGAAAAAGLVSPRMNGFAAPNRTEWSFLKARTPGFHRNGDGIYALAPERREKVLFLGDSHLAQYAERLDRRIASDPSLPGAVLALSGGCAPIEGVTTRDPQRVGCPAVRARGFELARSPEFGTVVIGGAWNWYLRYGDFHIDGAHGAIALSDPKGQEAALNALAGAFRALKAAGKRVVFVLDEPELAAFDPSDWPGRLDLTRSGFPPDRFVGVEPSQIALHAKLRAWAEALGVEIIDPFAAVCSDAVCRITSPAGQPVFKDDGHFNPDWALDNAAFIDVALRTNTAPP